ncbi:MAG TPA: universal stress protein [Chloroflexota bacterium]|nr:universal stress protein [Chloroflexota bacterium]
MLNKILVPLDGSELAERALTYATALAVRTEAQLLLVRAVTSHTLAGVDPRERQLGAIHAAESYLEQVARKLRERGLACETVVRYGHAAECVAESARTRQADLIVMATHGRTGPGRWVLGSVAETVVASSSVPVLVQRAGQPLLDDPLLENQPKLIVPLDGSAFAESALEPAARLAEELGGRLILVRVEDHPTAIHAMLEYLPRALDRVAEHHPDLPIKTDVRLGEAAYGIEEAVAKYDATLVVMATHGRGGVMRALLGSVAGKFMQLGDVPVVLIRPAPKAADQAPTPEVSASRSRRSSVA